MQSPSYVLLYNSTWDGDLYGEYVVAEPKLLSTEHPFTKLLLRQGSRPCADMRKYSVTLWRVDESKLYYWSSHRELTERERSLARCYRRQKVDWSSPCGPPQEEHLLLYQCIAAWVKGHKNMTLGAYCNPCKIVGSIRLDDGQHMGAELDINRTPILSDERYSYACGSTEKIIEAVLHSPYNNKAKRQLANEHGKSWESQIYFFLKDAVLSCTQVELQEVLREYMQTQAHEQTKLLKAELVEHAGNIASRRGEQ